MKCNFLKTNTVCIISFLILFLNAINLKKVESQFLDRYTTPIHLPGLVDKSNNLPRMSRIHYLMPFTKWEHLKPCGSYINEQEQFDQVLECTNRKFHKNLKTTLPRCFVVTTDSPDVIIEPNVNFIPLGIFNMSGFVGLYEPKDKTVYLIENSRFDNLDTYRHELLHYYLDLSEGDGNASHDHDIWNKCWKEQKYTKFKHLKM